MVTELGTHCEPSGGRLFIEDHGRSFFMIFPSFIDITKSEITSDHDKYKANRSLGQIHHHLSTREFMLNLTWHVLSQFVKGITEYSLTNFRSGRLNLSKLVSFYFSYIPACVVVAMRTDYYDP